MVHGDIKPENIMLTSYNQVFLTDLVAYKPSYFKDDDLKHYNLYFGEMENNNRCYFAPERFREQYDESLKNYNRLEKAMDIFSAGCVIAEIMMDGHAFFDLAKL
jgi:phosphoinositide-3-kinase, regulatory subunit 4